MAARKIHRQTNHFSVADIFRESIMLAYRKLKQTIYYDKADLELRHSLSKFEVENDIAEKLEEIVDAISVKTLKESPTYQEWLSQIKFLVIPKKLLDSYHKDDTQFTFISNVRTADKYFIERVNYVIEAPIELHIISMLWIILCGKHLDKKLSENCYGYRLHENVHSESDTSNQLFNLYHEQYGKWRNNAIKKAKHYLENEKENVAILGIDIKEFFYSVDVDFELAEIEINKCTDNEIVTGILCQVIADICKVFTSITGAFRAYTHSDNSKSKCMLPIGISFSGILANWYMHEFDSQISRNVNPVYYGRYVDDMLFVFRNVEVSNPHEFINDFFVEKRIFKIVSKDQSEIKYQICVHPNLVIQSSKFRLQYCDHRHSSASIEKFKKEIDKNSSAFRFLPTDDLKDRLNNVAYDLMYDGSINKFSSVKGISENRYEVSKYFAKQIAAHQLVETPANEEVLVDIRQFFQGKNIVDFSILWEKVFSYFIIKEAFGEAFDFYLNVLDVISRIEICLKIDGTEEVKKITNQMSLLIRKNLKRHLKLSLSMPLSLNPDYADKLFPASQSKALKECCVLAGHFRESNLLRHNLVNFPLINYSTYEGSYLKKDIPVNLELNSAKIDLTPRHINLHEYLAFYMWDNLNQSSNSTSYFDSAISNFSDGNDITCKTQNDAIRWSIFAQKTKDIIKIAIANIAVSIRNIECSFKGSPNISIEREYELWKLLNQIECETERVDLFIMPEVSVPYYWLPKLIEYSKHHMLGMVFGLEHINHLGVVYNLIVTLLPYYSNDGFKNCFIRPRIKNHYSHEEKFQLKGHNFRIPKVQKPIYDLFYWKGVNFSVYNCFEITNIRERAIFKDELDFVIISEYNKDIEYFSNIAESASRDLHCYVVQVNSSDFGDSRIVQPTKSFKKDVVRIKGGENSIILTANIDIKKLREFQATRYELHKDSEDFKPMPADFERMDNY